MKLLFALMREITKQIFRHISIPLSFLIALVLVGAIWSQGSARSFAAHISGCGDLEIEAINSDYEQQVIELVNAERASAGLPPLKRVDGLMLSSRYHAADMAGDDYFEHDTYDWVDNNLQEVCGIWDRIKTFYPTPRGENIAAGYPSPAAVVEGWMNSDGHRANILGSGWETGVGYYEGGAYGITWVQNFGKRSGVYPLVLAGEAASTDSPTVPVYIYGSWEEMRLRNDDDAWGAWQPFTNSFSWTLGTEPGLHTVTAELRSGDTILTSSDEIMLSGASMAAMGNLPDAIQFSYSLADGKLTPAVIELTPLNVGDGQSLEWNADVDANWLMVSPENGASPQTLSLSTVGLQNMTPGEYTSTLTIHASDPTVVDGSPHTITVQLVVIPDAFRQVFLPLLNH